MYPAAPADSARVIDLTPYLRRRAREARRLRFLARTALGAQYAAAGVLALYGLLRSPDGPGLLCRAAGAAVAPGLAAAAGQLHRRRLALPPGTDAISGRRPLSRPPSGKIRRRRTFWGCHRH